MGSLVSRLTALALGALGLWWLWGWLFPARERIQITSPTSGSVVSSPVTVQGIGQAIQHNTLGVRVRDEAGNEIGTGTASVSGPLGSRGPFSGTVSYTLGGPSGPGRIEVFDTSPRDGGLVHLSSVEVTLA